jgi:hypothetical protein
MFETAAAAAGRSVRQSSPQKPIEGEEDGKHEKALKSKASTENIFGRSVVLLEQEADQEVGRCWLTL